MINLDKINTQFNLNNFDASQIIKLVTEHKKIIRIAFVLISLLLVVEMYNDHVAKESGMRKQISQAQAKIEVIKARDAAVANLNNFKSSLSKGIDQFQLMTKISNNSSHYAVTIATLTPPQNTDMGLYDLTKFSFTAVADNFKGMMLFIRSIEQNNPPVKIDVWSGQEGQDGKVSSNIVISAVHIHS